MNADGGEDDGCVESQRSDWYKPYVGKLRYFEPHEIASLLGFPKSFSFPKNIPLQKQYALAGNSLHVTAVAALLELFFRKKPDCTRKRKLAAASACE